VISLVLQHCLLCCRLYATACQSTILHATVQSASVPYAATNSICTLASHSEHPKTTTVIVVTSPYLRPHTQILPALANHTVVRTISTSCMLTVCPDRYVGITEEHPASFPKYLRERFVDKLQGAWIRCLCQCVLGYLPVSVIVCCAPTSEWGLFCLCCVNVRLACLRTRPPTICSISASHISRHCRTMYSCWTFFLFLLVLIVAFMLSFVGSCPRLPLGIWAVSCSVAKAVPLRERGRRPPCRVPAPERDHC